MSDDRPRQRTRLGVEQRRAQILGVGAKLFASRSYDDVSVEEVAADAGISASLIYHYFRTKRDLAAAVIDAQATELLELTKPDRSLPIEARLRAGLDAYFIFAEANEDGYRALHSPGMIVDERIQATVDRCTDEQERRIAAAIGFEADVPESLLSLIHGSLAFTVAICLRWLTRRTMSREDVCQSCAQALMAMLSSYAVPPG